jgi:hypothetical protein
VILEGLNETQVEDLLSRLNKMYDEYSLDYLSTVLEKDECGNLLLSNIDAEQISKVELKYKRLFIVSKAIDIINKELYDDFMQQFDSEVIE